MQGALKVYVKSYVFVRCSGGRGRRRRGEHSFFIIFSKKALFQKWLKTQLWILFVPYHLHLWTAVPCPQH